MSTLAFSARRIAAAAAFVLVSFLAACAGRPPEPASADLKPTVLLVSLDGFRWDYLDLYDAPTLESLASDGVKAERLIPVFPSKTFPSHYSAVTGLYPGNHGIISNTMYDPELDARFSLSNREAVADARWWGGEPIWVTAEKQGQTAATYFWPGSEAAIQGVRPTYWLEFDGDVPGEERVDHVLEWLDLPESDRPTFLTLYFSAVDGAGHRHGPESPEVSDAVQEVDRYLSRLVTGLETRGILDEVNLIITSDHGMAETSPDRVVLLDQYFHPEDAHIVDYSPVLMMYPPEEARQETYEALKSDPHLEVYWKDELPERFHLQHPRTPPLLAIAEPGWEITTRGYYERDPSRYEGGAHGYDNRAASMGGIFIARGPAFKAGHRVPPFEIVHLYNLMCSILGLEPAPNDGDPHALQSLLRTEEVTR